MYQSGVVGLLFAGKGNEEPKLPCSFLVVSCPKTSFSRKPKAVHLKCHFPLAHARTASVRALTLIPALGAGVRVPSKMKNET